MILAITREYNQLIQDICKQNEYETPQILTEVVSLKKFALQESQGLNNYKTIIIDINSTKETSEDILKSIIAIKTMYNIKIIILAIGYEEGNVLLSKFFNEGIYNFVTATTLYEQENQLQKCMEEIGCEYEDAIQYRPKVEEDGKTKIIIQKEYSKVKQQVKIAVAGTQEHIGVTTQAMLIAKYLKNLNMNVCYICCNKEEIKYLEQVEGTIKKDNMLIYDGIDIYCNKSQTEKMKFGYDFYVYDYGVLNDKNITEFKEKEVKIIVGGVKVWEIGNTLNTINKLKNLNVDYIFNFASDKEKVEFKRFIKRYIKNLYFSEYVTEFLNEQGNEIIYSCILKKYVKEKLNLISVVEKKSWLEIFNIKKYLK